MACYDFEAGEFCAGTRHRIPFGPFLRFFFRASSSAPQGEVLFDIGQKAVVSFWWQRRRAEDGMLQFSTFSHFLFLIQSRDFGYCDVLAIIFFLGNYTWLSDLLIQNNGCTSQFLAFVAHVLLPGVSTQTRRLRKATSLSIGSMVGMVQGWCPRSRSRRAWPGWSLG